MTPEPGQTISERHLDEVSWQLAQQCRNIIQSCLREEEWIDADNEFYRVIRTEIYRLMRKNGRPPAGNGSE